MITTVKKLTVKVPHLNPAVAKATHSHHTLASLSTRNPIIHSSNRIVTVGLLSSCGKTRMNQFHTKPQKLTETLKDVRDGTMSTSGGAFAQLEAQMEGERKEAPSLHFYHSDFSPQQGAAFQFRYNHQTKGLIVDASAQKGEKVKGQRTVYDWENKLTFRANVSDLGKILSVLSGAEGRTSLLHNVTKETDKFTAIFVLEKSDKGTPVTVSIERKSENNDRSLNTTLNESEVALLTEFVRCSIRTALGF